MNSGNGMVNGADEAYAARLAQNAAWCDAEDRAAEVTKAKRQAHAIALANDQDQARDLVYQAIATVGDDAEQLCKGVARMIAEAADGANIQEAAKSLIRLLAKEAAADEVREENPEDYL